MQSHKNTKALAPVTHGGGWISEGDFETQTIPHPRSQDKFWTADVRWREQYSLTHFINEQDPLCRKKIIFYNFHESINTEYDTRSEQLFFFTNNHELYNSIVAACAEGNIPIAHSQFEESFSMMSDAIAYSNRLRYKTAHPDEHYESWKRYADDNKWVGGPYYFVSIRIGYISNFYPYLSSYVRFVDLLSKLAGFDEDMKREMYVKTKTTKCYARALLNGLEKNTFTLQEALDMARLFGDNILWKVGAKLQETALPYAIEFFKLISPTFVDFHSPFGSLLTPAPTVKQLLLLCEESIGDHPPRMSNVALQARFPMLLAALHPSLKGFVDQGSALRFVLESVVPSQAYNAHFILGLYYESLGKKNEAAHCYFAVAADHPYFHTAEARARAIYSDPQKQSRVIALSAELLQCEERVAALKRELSSLQTEPVSAFLFFAGAKKDGESVQQASLGCRKC